MDSPATLVRRPLSAHAIRAPVGRRAGVPLAVARRGVGTPRTVGSGGATAGTDRVWQRRAHQGRDAGCPARCVVRVAQAGPPVRVPRAALLPRHDGHRRRVAGLEHGCLHLFLLAARCRDSAAPPGSPRSRFAGCHRRAVVVPGLRAHQGGGRRRRSGDGLPRAGAVHRRRRPRGGRRRTRLRSYRLVGLLRGAGRCPRRRPPLHPRDGTGRLGAGGRRQRAVLETPARRRSGRRGADPAGERPERDAGRHSRERIPRRVSGESGRDLRARDRGRRAVAGTGGRRPVGPDRRAVRGGRAAGGRGVDADGRSGTRHDGPRAGATARRRREPPRGLAGAAASGGPRRSGATGGAATHARRQRVARRTRALAGLREPGWAAVGARREAAAGDGGSVCAGRQPLAAGPAVADRERAAGAGRCRGRARLLLLAQFRRRVGGCGDPVPVGDRPSRRPDVVALRDVAGRTDRDRARTGTGPRGDPRGARRRHPVLAGGGHRQRWSAIAGSASGTCSSRIR